MKFWHFRYKRARLRWWRFVIEYKRDKFSFGKSIRPRISFYDMLGTKYMDISIGAIFVEFKVYKTGYSALLAW